ncbi:unnamed protein product [Rotaria sp. Silwood2]|nr:unnamed protein product [Rotaria sp. Silwood2]CAF2929828.1 unnamed protein product [Rotaria sp. Silwood2]CAF4367463.1 unnamed protein product [Rotaria sp. Silwood2]CAF4426356.1 unnamed protein product [Rotaria sp. Silwood2]
MNKIIFSLLIINLFLFKSIITKSRSNEIDQQIIREPLLNNVIVANKNQDQQGNIVVLDEQLHLADSKFEELCDLKDKSFERNCSPPEQCLLTSSIHNPIKKHSLRAVLELKEDANQFLHAFSRRKRFLYLLS